jgi:hypothetical protein
MHPSPLEIAAAKAVPHSEYARDSGNKVQFSDIGNAELMAARARLRTLRCRRSPTTSRVGLGLLSKKREVF